MKEKLDKIKAVICSDCPNKTPPPRMFRSEVETFFVCNKIVTGQLKITLEEFISWLCLEKELEL